MSGVVNPLADRMIEQIVANWVSDPHDPASVPPGLNVHHGEIQDLVKKLIDLQPHYQGEVKGSLINARIPDSLLLLMDRLMTHESIRQIYPSRGDAIRESLYCWARAVQQLLGEEDARITKYLFQERIRGEAADAAQLEERLVEVATNLRDALTSLVNHNALEPAHTLIASTLDHALTIPHDYWRARHTATIRNLPVVKALATYFRKQGFAAIPTLTT